MPVERHIPAETCRSSSSGCSDALSPGGSPLTPGLRAPDRSYQYLTPCWTPGCSTETPSPQQPRYCWPQRVAGSQVTLQNHSTPLFKRKGGEHKRSKMRLVLVSSPHLSRDSPISLRLEKPAVMGACLGDLPRFGALDDQTLHPSPRDFSLQTKTTYEEQQNCFYREQLCVRHSRFQHQISNDNYCASGGFTDCNEILTEGFFVVVVLRV